MSDTTAANEYERERTGKRDQLRALGVDPYGHAERDVRPLADVKAMYAADMGSDGGPAVTVAGRIMLKRDMGKLSFLTLRDEGGDLQIALDKKRLDETAWQVNGLLDLGDQIVVDGKLGVTKKGEVTVWATALRVAAKSVLPPPGKWDGLSDVETRYRQRYVDLWANPDVMRTLRLRSAVVAEVRAYLTNLGLRRGRDANDAAAGRRRGRPAVHDAPQRAGHPALPADRPRAVPQAAARRRHSPRSSS